MTQVCMIVDSWSTAIPRNRVNIHHVKHVCKKRHPTLIYDHHIIMPFLKSNHFGGMHSRGCITLESLNAQPNL